MDARGRPGRIEPIIYGVDYHLANFSERFGELSLERSRLEELASFDSDLRSIFRTMEVLIVRLNDDQDKVSRLHKLLMECTSRPDKRLSDEEEDEMRTLEPYRLYYRLDVWVFFVQLSVFLDKIAKYLNLLFLSSDTPKDRSYISFKRSIKEFKGPEVTMLQTILNSYTIFDEAKSIRDDYIIHHSREIHGIAYSDEYMSVILSARKDGRMKSISISNEYLNAVILQLKSFLRDLGDFLHTNAGQIPFRIEKSG